jgi:ribosomal RNA-processing protein 8
MERLLKQKAQRSRLEKLKSASNNLGKNSNPIQSTTPQSKQNKSSPATQSSSLKQKLESGEFRWINEQLYTSSGDEAFKMFSEDPELFDKYHAGFRNQVRKWPIDPLEEIIERLGKYLKKDQSKVSIADLGCGEARLSKEIVEKFGADRVSVHSFDLVAANERIVACDISKVPLEDSSVDHAVFCLSLMGTNFVRFLLEASRILRKNGMLHIAEVESRFKDVAKFEGLLLRLGFNLVSKKEHKFFHTFEFKKIGTLELDQKQKKKLIKGGSDLLKPCLYKKR